MATRRPQTPNWVELPPEAAREERAPRSDGQTSGPDSTRTRERAENSLEVVARVQAAARDSRAKKSGKESSAEAGTESGSTPDQALPQHITTRYLKAGNRFHFPNRDLAFTDHGNKLSTRVANTEVIADLIDIAKTRGWGEINLAGTKEFKQEAWVQAGVAGISVRNYRATELDQEVLRRRLGRTGPEGPSAGSNMGTSPASQTPPAETTPPRATVEEPRPPKPPLLDRVDAGAGPRPDRTPEIGETFTGRLATRGTGASEYRVELEAAEGRRIALQGEDLRRALKESLSQPQVGDEVSVRYFGPEPVKATRRVRGEDGQVRSKVTAESTVNRWSVERSDFVQARANLSRVVRDAGIDGASAVRQHPSLAGVYQELKAAELKAQQEYPSSTARQQFVESVRVKLAQDIEQGKPMPAYRASPREATRVRRDLVQERTL